MGKKVLVTPRSLSNSGHPAFNKLEEAEFSLICPTPGKQPGIIYWTGMSCKKHWITVISKDLHLMLSTGNHRRIGAWSPIKMYLPHHT